MQEGVGGGVKSTSPYFTCRVYRGRPGGHDASCRQASGAHDTAAAAQEAAERFQMAGGAGGRGGWREPS